jgi:hypothetical protein
VSADLLRRAAKLMRDRAGATREPDQDAVRWYGLDGDDEDVDALTYALVDQFRTSTARADAEHIASWHPAVALAVAYWLDGYATEIDERPLHAPDCRACRPAVAVARAYLGEQP